MDYSTAYGMDPSLMDPSGYAASATGPWAAGARTAPNAQGYWQGLNGQWFDANGNPVAGAAGGAAAPGLPGSNNQSLALAPPPAASAGSVGGGTAPAPPGPAGGSITSGILAPYNVPPPSIPSEPLYTPTSFTAPTIDQALAQPGYQFQVQQGQQALQNWAAARGTLNDSGTAKSLIDYGQSAAQQDYGQVYSQMFNAWQANEAARQQAYGINRQSQYIDPWTAAYNEWQQQGNFYLGNQSTAANAALGFGNLI